MSCAKAPGTRIGDWRVTIPVFEKAALPSFPFSRNREVGLGKLRSMGGVSFLPVSPARFRHRQGCIAFSQCYASTSWTYLLVGAEAGVVIARGVQLTLRRRMRLGLNAWLVPTVLILSTIGTAWSGGPRRVPLPQEIQTRRHAATTEQSFPS